MNRIIRAASLAPMLLLAACGSSDGSKIDEKLAAAENAAQRAVEAQKAAEKAAAAAARFSPVPVIEDSGEESSADEEGAIVPDEEPAPAVSENDAIVRGMPDQPFQG